MGSKSRNLKEVSLDEEVMQANEHRQLPVLKEVKSVKAESSKEGVNNNQTSNAMETEQGRKVKVTSTNAKATPTITTKTTTNSTSSTSDLRNSAMNNVDKLHHRKRERTPSPTPSVPSAKRRANSPTAQSVNCAASEATGQPSNPKATLKPLGGTNNSLKLAGAARLVKPEMSSASKVLNEEIQRQQGQENARLKTLIFKEVKKQGKSYSPQTLFQYLEGVKGSVEIRRCFVQEVIREATKFKRKPLIQQLEEWADRLPSFRTASTTKMKNKSEKR
jgi:hypothetical protein